MVDELNPSLFMTRILYFPSYLQGVLNMDRHHIDSFLEESLSEILPLFYPLAGRYNRDGHYVDCDDQGADFSEARVDRRLAQLIGAHSGFLNHLLPLEICAVDDPMDPMLAICVTRFECGGLTIAVCASHRIFDSASLGIFLTAWANASSGGKLIIRPDFDIATYFPSRNLPPLEFQVSSVENIKLNFIKDNF